MTLATFRNIVNAHALTLDGLNVLDASGQVLAYGSTVSAVYAAFCNSRSCGFKPGFDGDAILDYYNRKGEQEAMGATLD